ncbi:hypothetical protein EYF80_003799 [Liparis tanakae]|uniref:Uncharacterized protein n=1 Tax=Liparis tanakae TaxID=230148 RepID=A0A4Z2J6E0_9TELE|nr:hypothetical protein EYF80_003799 [Liparis tanakae]
MTGEVLTDRRFPPPCPSAVGKLCMAAKLVSLCLNSLSLDPDLIRHTCAKRPSSAFRSDVPSAEPSPRSDWICSNISTSFISKPDQGGHRKSVFEKYMQVRILHQLLIPDLHSSSPQCQLSML